MPKVFLSAGHGGTDSGAVANGMKEKNVNLHMMLACKKVLESCGVTVVCSRTKDELDPVAQEVREANESGADIALSIHNNAGGGDGFEAFYHPTKPEGKKLAGLCEKYVKDFGQNSRGIKDGSKLYFIRKTKMPAVLVEGFFLDNATDKRIADTSTEWETFGVAYANAILEYFGITPTVEREEMFKSSNLYKVQVGAYTHLENAKEMQKKLSKVGFDSIIVR